MDSDTSFGQWLKQRRKALDLTQADLARQVGCAVITLQKIEAGARRPSAQIARRLGDALALAADEHTAFVRLARAESHHFPTNLPAPLTSLIGRVTDVAAVRERLLHADLRLLTLVGPPGIGKTCLAIQAADDSISDFAGGVAFVALAPIRDPGLAAAATAQALGVKEIAGQTIVESLKYALRARQMLLVLDNFEQVVAAAPLVSELLAAAPRLKILATSRTPLHITGEFQYAVPPLALPPATVQSLERSNPATGSGLAVSTFEAAIAPYAAVQLFVARAQAVQANFALTDANARDVAEICARLDGLPLAIELAAARIKLFTPAALLARLDRRFTLLTDGPRDLPARQQTLRSAIEWSYELLSTGEQALFRRLGVFVGGCTLEAAEDVCGSWEPGVGSWEDAATPPTPVSQLPTPILDGLAALIDQSLLQQETDSCGAARFTMLETIREYALEQLAANGEAEDTHRAHAAYFMALAEAAEPEFHGPEQRTWLARLEIEHDNLRAALAWALDCGETELGLRLAGAVYWFWYTHSHFREGRAWLARLMSVAEIRSAAMVVRVKALNAAGTLAFKQSDIAAGEALLDVSLALARRVGSQQDIARVLNLRGYRANDQGAYARALVLSEESLTLYREVGDKWGMATALFNLGRVRQKQGDYEQATALYLESLTLWQAQGDKRGVAFALNELGLVALHKCDYDQASARSQTSLVLFRELEDNWGIAWSLYQLGLVARYQDDYKYAAALVEQGVSLFQVLGDKKLSAFSLFELGNIVYAQKEYTRAQTYYMESLALGRELSLKELIAQCLEGSAVVAGVLGHMEHAVRLFGSAEALRTAIGAPLPPPDHAAHMRAVAATRVQLDEVTFAAAWAEGQAMSLEQALDEAQSLIREPAAPIRKPATPDDLISDAQWQRIAPLLPPAQQHHTGRPRLDDRQAMTAIFYALETGCGWKALPRALVAPSTIHDRFRAWRAAGVFERLWRAGMLTDAMARRIGLAQHAREA